MVKVIYFLLFFLPLQAAYHEAPLEPWGHDSDLAKSPQAVVAKTPSSKVSVALVKFYQNYISPIDGPRSSYLPCSSEYARRAIVKYGFFKGFVLSCDRLLRENHSLWVYETMETSDGERKLDPLR